MRSDWSVRELKRQMDSMLYERVGLSKDKGLVDLVIDIIDILMNLFPSHSREHVR